MIRPYQKAAVNKNIERAYDAMLEACATQRTFIDKNKRVPRPLVVHTRAQYAKNIKAVIQAKYDLTVAMTKPVSPCGSDVLSDSTKFIVDRLLSGEFKFVLSKGSSKAPNEDYISHTTSIVATDKSIPLTITMERRITREIGNNFRIPRGSVRCSSPAKDFKLDTSIPGLFTEREIEFIDANYYTDTYRLAKRIQEEADKAVEKAAAAGAIKEVTKLYKEAGLDIPK